MMTSPPDSLLSPKTKIHLLEQELIELKKKEYSLQKEVYHLKVLGEIKQAVLVDQSPQQFAQTAFNHLKKLIPCNYANVILFDFEKSKGRVLSVSGDVLPGVQPGQEFPLDECYLALGCLSPDHDHINALLLNPQPSCFMESPLLLAGLQSFISLLLISHNEVVGVLNIAALEPDAFSQNDILFARDVADSLAVAIQKAALFEQTRLKASELETLGTISSELRRAESWDQIIPILIRVTQKAMEATAAGFLWLEHEQLFCICDNHQERHSHSNTQVSAQSNLQAIMTASQPILATDPSPELQGLLPIDFQFASAALLPLKASSMLIGKLYLAFTHRREYSVEDVRLLASIADIAGNALYRANIVETLEQRVSTRTLELTTLYHVANIIGTSLDLEKALSQCLENLQTAIETEFCFIHLVDENSGTLRLVAALPKLLAVDLEGCILFNQVVTKDSPMVLESVAFPPHIPDDELSFIGIPIRGHTQVIGVVSFFYNGRAAFNKDTIKLLMAAVDHISIAIENDRLRRREQDAIVIEERQRLARELHDSISQLLYSQVLFAEASQKLAANKEYDLVLRYLNRLGEVANQAFKEMRLMIYALRPSMLESEGLVGALRHRLQTVEQRAGLETQLILDDVEKLPPPMENDLFRIAQEALNNTLKHASATSVTIHLCLSNSEVFLEVSDNGKGFNPEEVQEGIGFCSLRERAKQLGGRLKISSAPGLGTCVSIQIERIEKG